MRNYKPVIGDSFKTLQGYTMQHKDDESGYSIITFMKQVDSVILGINLKVKDDSTVAITDEYVFEILEEEQIGEQAK